MKTRKYVVYAELKMSSTNDNLAVIVAWSGTLGD